MSRSVRHSEHNEYVVEKFQLPSQTFWLPWGVGQWLTLSKCVLKKKMFNMNDLCNIIEHRNVHTEMVNRGYKYTDKAIMINIKKTVH